MKRIIVLLSFSIFIISACNKHERTLDEIYGNYSIVEYNVDGADSMDLFKDSLGCEFRFVYDDIYSQTRLNIAGYRNDGNEAFVGCLWGLVDNCRIIRILSSYGSSGTGPIGANKTVDWEILDIGDNELSLTTHYREKYYLIKLVK
jgi:hypothetical protein